ncbi:unnamed protein product [Rhodiola kirilowii]
MDADGDDVVMDGVVSSALFSSLDVRQMEQALSSEDLAWVDSCLVPDSDVPSVGSWDLVRDALLDVLSSQTVTNFESSDSGIPLSPVERVQHVDEETNGLFEEELEEKTDEIGDLVKELQFGNAFLPTYKEGVNESRTVEDEDNLGFVLDEDETELSVDEIFKVWELELPSEESDFVTQLNKALKSVGFKPSNPFGTSYETFPLSVDDVAMAKWEDIKDESLDNLIAGIADLSLSHWYSYRARRGSYLMHIEALEVFNFNFRHFANVSAYNEVP